MEGVRQQPYKGMNGRQRYSNRLRGREYSFQPRFGAGVVGIMGIVGIEQEAGVGSNHLALGPSSISSSSCTESEVHSGGSFIPLIGLTTKRFGFGGFVA
jgi:hypothetical protein